MSNLEFVLVSITIVVGLLAWYIRVVTRISDRYYGDESFVKIPTLFEVGFWDTLGFFSILLLSMGLLGISSIIYGFMVYFNDWRVCLAISMTGVIQLLLPIVEFYKTYWFLKINGKPKSYFFEPNERKLTITTDKEFSFVKADIREIIWYRFGGDSKGATTIIVFELKNGEKIVFTEVLPFFYYLEEFYGELHAKRVILSMRYFRSYLKWFSTLH
jgi:hypothetical protein